MWPDVPKKRMVSTPEQRGWQRREGDAFDLEEVPMGNEGVENLQNGREEEEGAGTRVKRWKPESWLPLGLSSLGIEKDNNPRKNKKGETRGLFVPLSAWNSVGLCCHASQGQRLCAQWSKAIWKKEVGISGRFHRDMGVLLLPRLLEVP